ncbi:hypothetical protein GOP47_0028302 [Adiantum capillus-veneris]|nr:hypothetical protein GOP47_0028302 [Adiantum capillus-veneris]
MSSNSGPKSKESFESWESLFRKTLSKDRLLNFTKPVENPIQWIHLLDPFDHQETRTAAKNTVSREGLAGELSPKKGHTFGDKLPPLKFPEAVAALAQAAAKASGESRGASSTDLSGWPLIPFSKVQMFKCEKCCLEFCSPVNHRRHLRVIHRRTAHAEKEDLRSQRQKLAAFWDGLNPVEASKIVDVKNLVLEDLVGEKVAKALSRLLQQPALFALPHSYVKSGAMLLELVQRRLFKPITSSELFKILDGSSEKTFPSFGLNAMQRYVFEGGAGKVGLEAKNLVSSLGFLVELNLVKAFIKDKDEEAWRCQTALVEEEEASQRKRAQIQEKKRMKKARQKDLKEKEQKAFDSTRASPSTGSESSDDEELSIANSLVGCDQQSRPSCNAYENLYHRLAGNESDSDVHIEEGSALPQVPAEDNQLPGELHDADVSELHPEVASPVVKEKSLHGSTRGTASVDSAGLEFEVECTANDSSKKGNIQVSTVSRKTLFREKRKYPTERNAEAKDFFVPLEKTYWKERHNLSFKKLPGQTMANSTKEGMDLAGPGVAFEESPANRVAGYRPRQVMGKPVKVRKYITAAQTGTAVWAKKAPKHSDTAGDFAPVQLDLAHGLGEYDSDPVACVEVPEARTDATADRSHEIAIDSPLSTPGSCGPSQQSSLAVADGGVCNLETHSSATLALDFDGGTGSIQARCSSSSLSSVVVGSLVIGSLCVSFVDDKASQDQRGSQSNILQDETEGRMVLEVGEAEPTGSVQSRVKVEESLRALHENGAVNCMPHKELERNGKTSKLPSQVDLEEKENQEHPPHAADEGKVIRPIVVPAGPRGGRTKVWRPIVSTASHASQDRRISFSPAATSMSANQTLTVELGKDASILQGVDPEEHDQGHPTLRNCTVTEPETTSAEECSKIEGNVVEELTVSVSTFEAVRDFLSQRWSTAMEAPETVVLMLEDEEDCESQNKGLCEDTVHMKDLRNPSLHASKDALSNSGNGRYMRGFLKQGCPGSAMATSRPIDIKTLISSNLNSKRLYGLSLGLTVRWLLTYGPKLAILICAFLEASVPGH